MPAKEIASGAEALKRVAAVLPSSYPLISTDQWGTPVRVEPGTVWGGNRLFVGNLGSEVIFTMGDKLWGQSPSEFIRDYYLIAAGQGAQRAEWLIPILQAEMQFCMSLGGAMAGSLGTAAALTGGLAKMGSFYVNNRATINTVKPYIGPILDGLHTFMKRCPKLTWLLFKGLAPQAGQSALQGISALDVAYFLGKLIGGIGQAATNAGPSALKMSLRGLIVVLTKTIAITTLLRGPMATVHGAPAQAKVVAQKLVKELQAGGITISESDALSIASEDCIRNPENQRLLQTMLTNAQQAAPLIETLEKALSAMPIVF